MKNGFAQAMAWLHTWAGLLVGWVLFVIFAGGTIACFDTELDGWMRPELSAVRGAPDLDALARTLRRESPDASAWYLYLPDARNASVRAGAYDERTEAFALHAYDPASGVRVRDTAGGEFFFTLHYNLQAGTIGMYLVGLAGMLMLLALATGVVIHKRIFKDFFLLRWRTGGQRGWLDGHNVAGVLGLPFHLMIAYSGVAIFVSSYMAAGVQAAYHGDAGRAYEESAPSFQRAAAGRPLRALAPLGPMVADARRRLDAAPWLVTIQQPLDAAAYVNIAPGNQHHVGWNARGANYDGATGAFLGMTPPPSDAYRAYSFLGGLHMVQFGGSGFRWLYFVLGLSGCVMLATGMQVWVDKRERRGREAGVRIGHGLVRALNVGVVAGMPLASVAMLWANRLVPVDVPARATQEIRVFCVAWIASALWAWWRLRRGSAWRDLFAATALACLGLPVLSALVAPQAALPATLPAGRWAFASVDLVLLAFGLAYAWLARKAARSAARGTNA